MSVLVTKIRKIPHAMRTFIKVQIANSVGHQRAHWQEELAKYDWDSPKIYGNDWGDPENPNDRLGNYLEIKRRLMAFATPDRVILEIGSLGGKWTQFLLNAQKIICVDLNTIGFDYIRRKLPYPNIEFYLTKGNELAGIPDKSVDVIFSMDTLVRTPKRCIKDYFREIRRTLKPGGRLFLHLPCTAKEESRGRGFVPLTVNEIKEYCRRNRFQDVRIDMDVIKHGVILEAKNP